MVYEISIWVDGKSAIVFSKVSWLLDIPGTGDRYIAPEKVRCYTSLSVNPK